MTGIWFRPKKHGYGVTPANWKGWVAILGYVFGLVFGTVVLLSPDFAGGPPSTARILLWAALVGFGTAAFVRLSKERTDGEWKWRWGERS